MHRVALYARVSTKDQDDYGTSLDSQIKRMREYMAQRGLTIVAEYSEDYTGTTPDRPKINEIKKLAKDGLIDAILTYSRDRYARSRFAGMMLDMEFRDAGVDRLYVMREQSVDTPQGKLRDGFDDLLHEYELENIRERTLRGRIAKAEQGVLIGSGRSVIYGYTKIESTRIRDLQLDDRPRWDIPRLQSPVEVVRYIFVSFVHDGLSADKIATQLNAFGIPAPRGRMWRSYTIYAFLHREEYTGQFYANKLRRTYNERTGKYQPKERPREEWISIVREDLRIISNELFEMAKDRLSSGKGVTTKYNYLFSRRVKCEHNHKMTCTYGHDRVEYRRHYYTCRTNKWMLKKCDMPYFPSTQIDEMVWQWVMDLIEDPDAIIAGMKKAQERADDSNREAYEWLEAIERLIAEKTDERDYLIEEARHFRNNPSVREKYRGLIEEATQALAELEDNKRAYEQKIEQGRLSDNEIKDRTRSITKLNMTREQLSSLSFKERRQIITLLNVEIQLGVKDGRKWCDVQWYGDTERIYLEL